jgi:ketosteroid isomerase-like protein
MKIGLVVVLVGSAIGFALANFAQQANTPDPQIVQQLHAIGKKSDEAFLKGNAAALAALYTEDAVLVNDTGPVYGRQAIEKYYADMFQTLHYFSHDTRYDPTSPHPIGSDGNGVWETGEWSSAIAPRGEERAHRHLSPAELGRRSPSRSNCGWKSSMIRIPWRSVALDDGQWFWCCVLFVFIWSGTMTR